MEIIDAHQHLWQLARPECQWPTPDLTPIYRDFSAVDFNAVSGPVGVSGSVLVQSQPCAADTEYLLQQAEVNAGVGAVVGWADLAAPESPRCIAQLARHRKLRGLRPMLQCIAEPDWIIQPAQAPGLEAMITARLSLDALISSRHLGAIRQLAARYPELNIIIDHGAKPNIADGQWGDWYEPLAALAAQANVSCKLSGLITEAATSAELTQTGRYIEALWRLFGPDRLLWGSDWPVLNLQSDYPSWLTFCRQWLNANAPEAEAAVLAGNAKRLYRIQ